MAKRYIQYSDIQRVETLIRAEEGSLKQEISREREQEAEVQGLSVRPGQRVLDKITNTEGRVLYAARKTVILPYSAGRE